jgi:multidrug efflux pump subunit AcrB
MKSPPSTMHSRHGLLAWFAHNHVAANLVMIAVVVTGLLVARNIRQEIYPTFTLNTVEIDVIYRGASPDEVEHSIILPIEAELRGMDLIREVRSIAREGRASVTAELVPGTNKNRGLQEITAAVQRINLFPDDAEPPSISLDTGGRRGVLYLAVYGDLDEQGLAKFGRQIEQGLLAEPGVSFVQFRGLRQPEIQVIIPQAKLRALRLRMSDVAQAIKASALDVPAGSIRTKTGDFILKTTERRSLAKEFAEIAVLSLSDGTKVLLGDIASIKDDFEESNNESYFNGKPSLSLAVYSAESQSPLSVANTVQQFIEREQANLPDSVGISIRFNRSAEYKERIDMLLTNGSLGLILVLIALGFFLELRVAFWTAIGIPVSIIGSLTLLPSMDASINMNSLFAFIVTLGIVVDDAVVVGEEIFHRISKGAKRLDAAIDGVKAMAVPVIFAVSTNIIAFLPLLFVPGETGRFYFVIPAVVIAVFTISLVECLFILPSHLANGGTSSKRSFMDRLQGKQTEIRIKMDAIIDRWYRPLMTMVISNRYVTCLFFFGSLIVSASYVYSGRVDFVFRPSIESPFIQAEFKLPSGTSVERTREVAKLLEESARRALERNGEPNILTGIGIGIGQQRFSSGDADVSVRLVPQSQRKITAEQFCELWREEIPEIADLESVFFDYLYGPGGANEIDIQISHPEISVLRQVATEVAQAVSEYPGVADVNKGFGKEMPQFNFKIKPEGRGLGITAQELGTQIRHAFYGAEAIRQPRGREELRVMVKLPEEERGTLSGLENLLIHVPQGGEIPLNQAARIIQSEAPVRIERVDGARVYNVSANVIPGVTTGNKVLASLGKTKMPEIVAKYPGLRFSFEGDQREQRDSMQRMSMGLLGSVFVIYAIMAALLRSYLQALLVLIVIPWSLAGAIAGHIFMGITLSVFSVFGMIALCGMVVNGAFVLAITRNRYIEEGFSSQESILLAAQRRFRPIILTALTTFLGLGPMIFESSFQAQYLVPMAISLGVGTLVSAVVILTLIPSLMVIVDELRLEPLTERLQPDHLTANQKHREKTAHTA